MTQITYAQALALASDLTKGIATLMAGVDKDGNTAGPGAGLPASLGQQTMAQSLPVVLASNQSAVPITMDAAALAALETIQIGSIAAGEAHIGAVGGAILTVRVEKTRDSSTTAYAINDIINESASAGTDWTFAVARSGGPGTGVIVGLMLQTDNAANVAQCEIDVYDTPPAASINDNAEATHLYTDSGKLLQTVLLPALAKKTSGSNQAEAYAPCAVPFKAVDLLNLTFRLRTLTVFTPVGSAKYKITAFVAPD